MFKTLATPLNGVGSEGAQMYTLPWGAKSMLCLGRHLGWGRPWPYILTKFSRYDKLNLKIVDSLSVTIVIHTSLPIRAEHQNTLGL